MFDVTQDITLLHGDCIEQMSHIRDGCVDMVLTDLPYGTTKNNWDAQIDLEQFWQQITRICKERACIALWAQEPFTTELVVSNNKWFRYKWIVEKTNATGFLNAGRMPLKSYEELLIFYKKLPVYNPQKTTGHKRKVSTAHHRRNSRHSSNYNYVEANSYDSTERFPRDIVTFSWDKQKTAVHPTQKPVAALEYFINTYTNAGDLVLDATMGSGSTGIACINTGRRFAGIELSSEYFQSAQSRIYAHYDETAAKA